MKNHLHTLGRRGTSFILLAGAILVAGTATAAGRDQWVVGTACRDGRCAVTAVRSTDGLTTAYTLDAAGAVLDSPAVCLDGTGRAAAVWVRRDDAGHHLMVSRFAGGRWTVPRQAAAGAGYLSTPSVSFADDDSLWIAWASQEGPSDDISVIRWRERTEAGPWTFGHPDYPDLTPAVAADGPGRASLVWHGCDGSGYRWLRSFYRDGSWSVPAPLMGAPAVGRLSLAGERGAAAAVVASDAVDEGSAGAAPFLELRALAARPLVRALGWDTRPGSAWSDGGKIWSGPLPGDQPAGDAAQDALPVETLAAAAYDRSIILGVGDSTTYGRGSTANGPPTDYLSRLRGKLKGPWVHVNRGVPGDESSGILSRMDTELSTYRGGLTILFGGTNDAYNGLNPLSTVANLHLAAHKVLDRGGKLLMATTPPVFTSLTLQFQRLALLNPLIVDMAASNGFELVDLWTLMRAVSNWEMRLMDPVTQIHPNDAGYELIASRFRQRILRRNLLNGNLRWQAMEPLRTGQLTAADSAGSAQLVLDHYSYLAQDDITAMAALDLDGDGVDSIGIVRSANNSQTLTIYSAPLSGSFDKTTILAEVLPVATCDWINQSSGWITHLFGIDLDGDGKDEIGLVRLRAGTQVLEIWRAHQPGMTTPVRLVYDEWTIPAKGRVKSISAIQADGDAPQEVLILTEAYLTAAQGIVILDTPPTGADTQAANNEAVLYQNFTALPGPNILQVVGQDISDPPDGLDELVLLRTRRLARNDLLEAYALPALPAADNTPLVLQARDRWVRITGCETFLMDSLRLSDGAGGIIPSLSLWLNP